MKATHKEVRRKTTGTARRQSEEHRVVLEADADTVALMQADMRLSDELNTSEALKEAFGGEITVTSMSRDEFDYLVTPEVLGHIRADEGGAAATAGEYSEDFIATLSEYLGSEQHLAKRSGAHRDKTRFHQAKPAKPAESSPK